MTVDLRPTPPGGLFIYKKAPYSTPSLGTAALQNIGPHAAELTARGYGPAETLPALGFLIRVAVAHALEAGADITALVVVMSPEGVEVKRRRDLIAHFEANDLRKLAQLIDRQPRRAGAVLVYAEGDAYVRSVPLADIFPQETPTRRARLMPSLFSEGRATT